jgi:hypothetical protein
MRRESSTLSASTNYKTLPGERANAYRGVITTAEAAMTVNSIIGFLAVDLKEIRSDVPLRPNRM